MDAKQQAVKKRQLVRAQTAAIAAVRQTESRLGASAMGLDDNSVVALQPYAHGVSGGSGRSVGSGVGSGSARGVGASRLRHMRMLSAVEEDNDSDGGGSDGGDMTPPPPSEGPGTSV